MPSSQGKTEAANPVNRYNLDERGDRYMRFNGRLQTEADPHGWLKSEISISASKVELSSGDDLLGSWPVGHVKAERLDGDRFELHLGEDRAVFAADDALAFSYEALPKLTKKPLVEAASGFRKLLGGGRKNHTAVAAPAPVAPPPDPNPATEVSPPPGEVPPTVKRLRELIEVAKANRPDEAETTQEEQPFLMMEPVTDSEPERGPLWSMPENTFTRNPPANPQPANPQPAAFSIVEPVDLAPAFQDGSKLADEVDQLAEHIKRSQLTSAQTEAAIGMIRSLRSLLDN